MSCPERRPRIGQNGYQLKMQEQLFYEVNLDFQLPLKLVNLRAGHFLCATQPKNQRKDNIFSISTLISSECLSTHGLSFSNMDSPLHSSYHVNLV